MPPPPAPTNRARRPSSFLAHHPPSAASGGDPQEPTTPEEGTYVDVTIGDDTRVELLLDTSIHLRVTFRSLPNSTCQWIELQEHEHVPHEDTDFTIRVGQDRTDGNGNLAGTKQISEITNHTNFGNQVNAQSKEWHEWFIGVMVIIRNAANAQYQNNDQITDLTTQLREKTSQYQAARRAELAVKAELTKTRAASDNPQFKALTAERDQATRDRADLAGELEDLRASHEETLGLLSKEQGRYAHELREADKWYDEYKQERKQGRELYHQHTAEIARLKQELASKEVKAFERLKDAFKEATMLAHFDPDLETWLETDASDYVTAAVLLQMHDSVLKPVAFLSHKITLAECNYKVYNKKLLAIVQAFEE